MLFSHSLSTQIILLYAHLAPRSGAVAGALSVAAHGPRTRTARNAPNIPARLFQQRHRPLWSVRLLNDCRKGLSMARIPETEIMKRIVITCAVAGLSMVPAVLM